MNIQAQSCLKVVQRCRQKIVFGYPKDEDSSKATLTSGRGGKKDRNTAGIEKSREREGLASSANMKVGKLVVSSPPVRVYFSPL